LLPVRSEGGFIGSPALQPPKAAMARGDRADSKEELIRGVQARVLEAVDAKKRSVIAEADNKAADLRRLTNSERMRLRKPLMRRCVLRDGSALSYCWRSAGEVN